MSRVRGRSSRLAVLVDAFRSSIWPVPTAAILLAVMLGIALPELDRSIDGDLPAAAGVLLFGGGAEAARAVLSAISGSLITATSLTFSLTVVALQLASSQASPRLLRLFAGDRMVHATMAVFLGTFAYALTVLRTIRTEGEEAPEFVPQLSVTLGSVFTFVSVVMLALFLAHLARQLRVDTMLRAVSEETRRTLESLPPVDERGSRISAPALPNAVFTVPAAGSGFLVFTDRDRLLDVAREFDLVVAEEWATGSSVIEGSPVAYWWPRGADPSDAEAHRISERIRQAFRLEFERTSAQDPGFGLRQLVDVALKAVSPGVNDPTTAVHALSHLSALLCSMVGRPAEQGMVVDDDGVVRLIRQPLSVPAHLELSLGQLRQYGAGDPEVALRMMQLLREVAFVNRRPDLVEPLREQVEDLLGVVRQHPFTAGQLDRIEATARATLDALTGIWTPTADLVPLLPVEAAKLSPPTPPN